MPLFLTTPNLWEALGDSDEDDDDDLWILCEWHDEGWARGDHEGALQAVEDTQYNRARDDYAILDDGDYPVHLADPTDRKNARKAYRRGYTDGYETGYHQVYRRHAPLLRELQQSFAIQWAMLALLAAHGRRELFEPGLLRVIRTYADDEKVKAYRPINRDLGV